MDSKIRNSGSSLNNNNSRRSNGVNRTCMPLSISISNNSRVVLRRFRSGRSRVNGV